MQQHQQHQQHQQQQVDARQPPPQQQQGNMPQYAIAQPGQMGQLQAIQVQVDM